MKTFWLCLAVLCIGLIAGKVYFSKTKYVTVEHKVYSMPENITLQEMCDSLYGRQSQEAKAKVQDELSNYEQGLREGTKIKYER